MGEIVSSVQFKTVARLRFTDRFTLDFLSYASFLSFKENLLLSSSHFSLPTKIPKFPIEDCKDDPKFHIDIAKMIFAKLKFISRILR